MSDEDKVRKTITMTHKQAGWTFGGLTSSFALLHFLNGYYYPISDAKALTREVHELKDVVKDGFKSQTEALTAHSTDERHTHERMMDVLREEITHERDDRIKDDGNVGKRIDLVMELFKIKASRTN